MKNCAGSIVQPRLMLLSEKWQVTDLKRCYQTRRWLCLWDTWGDAEGDFFEEQQQSSCVLYRWLRLLSFWFWSLVPLSLILFCGFAIPDIQYTYSVMRLSYDAKLVNRSHVVTYCTQYDLVRLERCDWKAETTILGNVSFEKKVFFFGMT